MTRAYIGLGSNLGEPEHQLRTALRALDRIPATRLLQPSSFYRSRAVGPGEQPDYLNAVAALETGLSPHELLDHLQRIELEQGRVRSLHWGPRTLDLDILLYDDREICDRRLTVPHPRLAERNFVLHPLAEITGDDLRLPGGIVLGALLAGCDNGHLIRTSLRTAAEGD